LKYLNNIQPKSGNTAFQREIVRRLFSKPDTDSPVYKFDVHLTKFEFAESVMRDLNYFISEAELGNYITRPVIDEDKNCLTVICIQPLMDIICGSIPNIKWAEGTVHEV
jgi:hypothetical protein